MGGQGRARNAIHEREEQVEKYRLAFRARESRFALSPLTLVFCRLRFGQSQRPPSRRTLRYQTRNSSRNLFKSYRTLLEVSDSCHTHSRSRKYQMVFLLYSFLYFSLSHLSFREVIKFTRDAVIFNNTTFPTTTQKLRYIVQTENHLHIERCFQLSVGKSKAITLANHKGNCQSNEPIKLHAKRGKPFASELQLVWFYMTDLECGARFFVIH